MQFSHERQEYSLMFELVRKFVQNEYRWMYNFNFYNYEFSDHDQILLPTNYVCFCTFYFTLLMIILYITATFKIVPLEEIMSGKTGNFKELFSFKFISSKM